MTVSLWSSRKPSAVFSGEIRIGSCTIGDVGRWSLTADGLINPAKAYTAKSLRSPCNSSINCLSNSSIGSTFLDSSKVKQETPAPFENEFRTVGVAGARPAKWKAEWAGLLVRGLV